MKIIFVSNLSNNIDAGLNWSVPASVKAQQKFDDVLWVDLTPNAFQAHWGTVEAYHNIKEYGGELRQEAFPSPFNKPDVVVFEGFYYAEQARWARKLYKEHIPYIIVPRGSLTSRAFELGGMMKQLKKKLANLLIFNQYVRRAAAIQYLTQDEAKESSKKYKTRYFIIPNGFDIPLKRKAFFSDGIHALFIGRLDIFHKGLDLLFSAIAEMKDELNLAGFVLDIYGAPRYDVEKVSELIEKLKISNIVVNHRKAITGDEKQQVILDADIFVLTSRFEGHPMGLIEALAYGLPVLITRGTNMLDEVCNAKAGWTSETSLEGIKQSLRQMIADKSRYAECSQNAISLSRRYNWDKLAERLHNELEMLVYNNK